MSQFQVISLGNLCSFTLISTELPLIFSARSGPFWQEVEALRVLLLLQALKCNISQYFLVISPGKLSSFTFISKELPLISSASSRPFWQEADVLQKLCFCFQPSDLGQGHFSRRNLEKILNFFTQVVKILIICNFSSWRQHEPKTMKRILGFSTLFLHPLVLIKKQKRKQCSE